jgi:hypothetical protein
MIAKLSSGRPKNNNRNLINFTPFQRSKVMNVVVVVVAAAAVH